MSFINKILAATAAATLALPAYAGDIMIKDAYVRTAMKGAKSGAAFMQIMNHSETDDRLIAAASDIAKRVELHTHEETDGVMRMIHVEEGFDVEAGGMIEMGRGARHVMMMGLTGPLEQGAMVPVTLTFETAGDIEIMVPVDLERKPAKGHGHSGHSDSKHSGHKSDS